MADPVSTVANVSAMLSLVDVVCRAGKELFMFFTAIKDASKDIRKVAEELQQFVALLTIVQATVEQRETSNFTNGSEPSLSAIVEALKGCQSELIELSLFVDKLRPNLQHGKAIKLASKVRWVMDEKRVIQSCQRLERRKLTLITALSVIGMKYDLILQEQVKLTQQELLRTSEAARLQQQDSDHYFKHELGSVRSLSVEVRDNVTELGNSMESNLALLHEVVQNANSSGNAVQERIENANINIKDMNDGLRRAIAKVDSNASRSTQTIEAAFKRNLKIQMHNARRQKISSLRTHQGLEQMQSMLAGFIVTHARNDNLDVDYFRVDGVEVATAMMPLMLMSAHMPSMFNKLAQQLPFGMSREDIDTFHKEFNQLLAACHEASARELKESLAPTACTTPRSTTRRTTAEVAVASRSSGTKRRLEQFSSYSSVKRQRHSWTQHLTTGSLSIVVEAQQEEEDKTPVAVFSASFVPRHEICSTGLLTMFKQTVTRATAHTSGEDWIWLQALIKSGADIAARDEGGHGPLHLSLMTYTGKRARWEFSWDISKDVIKKLSLLLKAGCDPNLVDYYGKRPVHYARRNGLLKEWNAVLSKLAIYYDSDDETSDEKGYEVYLAYDQRCHCFNHFDSDRRYDERYDAEDAIKCHYLARGQRCLGGEARESYKRREVENVEGKLWEYGSTPNEHEQDDDSCSEISDDDGGGVPLHSQAS
ncbi:hypothetical protein MMC17_005407 [Xylographa soralifera]|nr:hypothetical protein [Xylographa soralifera]